MTRALNTSTQKPVTVVFTQNGEVLHNWETGMANIKPLEMLDAVCCTGLVNEEEHLAFIVYDDDNDDVEKAVFMEGIFHPNFIKNP
jgi:hypothetical protein